MKAKIFLLFIVLFAGSVTKGQDLEETQVPPLVISKFKKMYAAAEEVDWSQKNNLFIAELDINEKEVNVIFDNKGNFLQKETEMEDSEIPKPMMDYFQANYLIKKEDEAIKTSDVADKTVLWSLDAFKVTDSNGKVSYKIDAISADLFFDAKGNFIKEEKKEGEG